MANYSSSFVPASIGAPPQPQPFPFENLNASSSAGAQPTRTLQLIDCVQGQGVAASCRNQQNVPFANENKIGQLGLGLRDDYWTYEKRLPQCDVSRSQCRLLLGKSFVEDHILPYIDAGQCRSANGIPIAVWDADKSRGFQLTLKQRPCNGSCALNGNWNNFVDEVGLKEGDKVGFTYTGSTLFFKRLN